MIYAAPGASFEATVEGFPTGLAGTVGVRILDNAGATTTARATAGILEYPAGSGFYQVTLTAPTGAGQYSVFWDTGAVGPTTTAAEDLVVTSTQPGGSVPAGSDLCTLADVRQFLETDATDLTRDALFQSLITRASSAIMKEVEREFAPLSTAVARSFRWDMSQIIELAPYDCRALTTVVLSPEAGSPQTLTAGSDYLGTPIGGVPDGVFTNLRMSNLLIVRTSTTLFRFGFMEVQVTGDWGFPSVPTQVAEACVETVASWVRRDVAAFANREIQTPDGFAPQAAPVYGIPPGALKKLNPFRRNPGVY